MKLIPFKIEHFDQVEWQAPQEAGRAYYRREWAEEIAQAGNAFTGVAADGYIVGCCGVIPTRIVRQINGPDVSTEALAWAIFSPRLGRHAKDAFRAIRDFLDQRPEYRIIAYVDADHERASPFIERLGFVFEDMAEETHPRGTPLKRYVRMRN